MMENTKKLSEYLALTGKDGSFVIPNYQRGYVWGQYKTEYKVDSVTNMLNTLIDGFNNSYDVFVQGITVYEKGDASKTIYLVDGQQRTTFFFLLLNWLGYDGHFRLTYSIREESNRFLTESLQAEIDIIKQTSENDYLKLIENEQFQDIYFFKKTLCSINKKLSGIEKKSFKRNLILLSI